MKLLLDGDMHLFSTMASVEQEFCIYDEVWTRSCDLAEAREKYWEQLDELAERFNATRDDVIHCFTDRSTFRKNICPDYKANRRGQKKPIGYSKLKSELLELPYSYMHDQVEADDLLGIFATALRKRNEPYVIVSRDKDLRQIPGPWTWFDMEADFVDPAAAEQQFWKQALIGDGTDGVKGCPGVGEKTAARAIDEFDITDPMGCWEKVVSIYEKKGLDEAYALQQARLVRILRAGEYDFNTKQVQLWNPALTTISA